MTVRGKIRLIFFGIIVLALAAGFLDYPRAWNKSADWLNAQKNKISWIKSAPNIPQYFNVPFRLGLDLQGGTHLVYEADLSQIDKSRYDEAMQGVRDVIERRVNLFGVAEPLVQVDKVGGHYRLIVELAGIKDIHQAIQMIGETPALDFREEKSPEETQRILDLQKQNDQSALYEDPYFGHPTALTGKYLQNAQVSFDQNMGKPEIDLQFNEEGAKLFEELTSKNVNKRIAIYLDGQPISAPTVQEAISGGKARITGTFTLEEAKTLVKRLNAGALPVPIKLINQETIGASLGKISLMQSLLAGLIGLLAVAVFMMLWYRLPGLLAVLALLVYTAVVLAIFKLIPVTLTLAGIAGFILSIGMAVDANILIFERTKEELKSGKSLGGAIDEGFKRAWTSIRDSNVSSLITCLILFWLGTSVIKGFALTLAIGIVISLFSAITVTRTFLKLTGGTKLEKFKWMWK
ncbi:MAG: Preprotein translocase subunit SecD [Parcubacteria group bacterium GW2011_GWF2_39_13b]|nr:MAG: Preprotein translocase subunit SecD [Parcubacteria group bacterium GW2011_GWF2_39_13b]